MTTAADPNARARTLAGFPAQRTDVTLAGRALRLYTVADLDALVDRAAVLRGDVDPPYWAHLWSGARVLAEYVARWLDVTDRSVLEIGCGLGLPALTAATHGGRVTVIDERAEALAFVAASAAANGVACAVERGDFTRLAEERRFDVVLAAEVAYERERFAELAAVFARHLAANGLGLLADGHRTDTRRLYRELGKLDLATHAVEVRVLEEGRPAAVRLTTIRRR